jgi:hypothetical protein
MCKSAVADGAGPCGKPCKKCPLFNAGAGNQSSEEPSPQEPVIPSPEGTSTVECAPT